MLLSMQDISKAYGDNQVLNGVTLALHSEQKVGLVGANGVGKSTLLKIVVGQLEPDTGTVEFGPGVEIGYLPQLLTQTEGQTVAQLMDRALGGIKVLEAQMRQLEAQMASGADDLDAILAEYGRLSEQFERRGGYELDYRTDQVMAGLRIEYIERDRPVATLSGGEKTRIGLAALLLSAPDLLLLDEPTNHLDFATLEWLETYLQKYRGGLLAVSHDRQFLNRTVDTIVEIVEHSREAKQYSGNYDFYAQIKAEERTKWVERYWQQQEEIWELRKAIKQKARQVAHNRAARDGDKFLYNFKDGRVTSAIARNVRNAEERLRRIEADPVPKPPQELSINPDFEPQSLTGHIPLVATGLRKRYGALTVLDGVDCSVGETSRVVIVGPNGAGKSTLLKILAGVEPADAGEVKVAGGTVVGHLDQEQETMHQRGTLFEAYRNGRIGDPEAFKAELLRYGLFVYEDLHKPVADLSVGQKRKLQIAQLIAQRANLLLLDEPTNHISLDVLEEFEQALLDFPGPVIAVSHDRRFIQRFTSGESTTGIALAPEIWTVGNGHLQRFIGSWEEYMAAQPSAPVLA